MMTRKQMKKKGRESLKEHYLVFVAVCMIAALDGRMCSESLRRMTRRQGNPAFGRTRGVFSGIVNQISSGSIIVTVVAAIASVTGSENAGVLTLRPYEVSVWYRSRE